MASPPVPIAVSRSDRQAAAARVAADVCRRHAAFGTSATPSGGPSLHGSFLRVVCCVDGETATTIEVEREGLVAYAEVGGLVEACLLSRVALCPAAAPVRRGPSLGRSSSAAAAPPPAGLGCWLTLRLDDGCDLAHAFFAVAAEPVGLTGELLCTAAEERAALVRPVYPHLATAPPEWALGDYCSNSDSDSSCRGAEEPPLPRHRSNSHNHRGDEYFTAGVSDMSPSPTEEAARRPRPGTPSDVLARPLRQQESGTPQRRPTAAYPNSHGSHGSSSRGSSPRCDPSGHHSAGEAQAVAVTPLGRRRAAPPSASGSTPPSPQAESGYKTVPGEEEEPWPARGAGGPGRRTSQSPAPAPPLPAAASPAPPSAGPALSGPSAPQPPRHQPSSGAPPPPLPLDPRRPSQGGPLTVARLASPSPQGRQGNDWARRAFGSPYREELWRLGEASMTTNLDFLGAAAVAAATPKAASLVM